MVYSMHLVSKEETLAATPQCTKTVTVWSPEKTIIMDLSKARIGQW